MAKFRFKHAVMSAGKSQELARVHYNYKIKDEKILVLVPSTDNRSGVGVVAARSGETFLATSVNPGEVRVWLEENLDSSSLPACILTDETQFFKRDDIFALKEMAVIERNIPVIAYGLKSDFMNNLFEGSSACMVVAEEITQIETICSFCNKMAIMNMRFQDGKPTREGEQVLIGDEEYRQVCHYHYLQDDLEIKVTKGADRYDC